MGLEPGKWRPCPMSCCVRRLMGVMGSLHVIHQVSRPTPNTHTHTHPNPTHTPNTHTHTHPNPTHTPNTHTQHTHPLIHTNTHTHTSPALSHSFFESWRDFFETSVNKPVISLEQSNRDMPLLTPICQRHNTKQ